MDVLTRAESRALLQRRILSLTPEHSERLAELLGDLPLALEQAAAYLETTGLPVLDYLELVQQRGGDMLDRGRALGYQHRLATVWTPALERVSEQRPAVRELVGLCAYLAPEAIPLELFTTHPDLLPPVLAEAVSDPLEWAETVGMLVNYSLVRRNEQTISLHRLFQTALRHHDFDLLTQTQSQHADRRTIMLDLLRADLPGTITSAPQNWPRWQLLLRHVLAVTAAHDASIPANTDTSAWLLDRAATYLQVLGQPATARPLFERALRITETAYGSDHPTVAITLNNLAGVLGDLGRPEQAGPLFERALRITETAHGPDHPEVGTIAGRLGHGGGGATTLRVYAAWVAASDRKAAEILGSQMPKRTPRGLELKR